MIKELTAFSVPRPTAVLDDAHVGDIRGALGTIRQHDTAPRHSWKARLLTLLAVMGPGLVVMVGDNDAGGVATYTQAGQNYGTSLLWVLLLLIPVLIVNQEMVVRLGLVTGVGHARLIIERFGTFWGAFSVGDLFLLNFLTIVTEFIGINLGMAYFGVSPLLAVPVAAAALILFVATGSFRHWERWMYLFVALSVLTIPLALLSHPTPGPIVRDTLVPSVQGGLDSTALLVIIAIVGTTVAPWQLFFQQSNVIDKRLTPRWMAYERADTAIGAVFTIVGAGALVIAAAFAFGGTDLAASSRTPGRSRPAWGSTWAPWPARLRRSS
jgi:NRAMP (natural resistance-associated macrophage protein)-like metal ion transporter